MNELQLKSRIRSEYDASAGAYERRWRDYVTATVRETVNRIPRTHLTSVLDIGCGTGSLLARVSEEAPDCALAGVDLSPVMIATARARLPQHARLTAADAESLPFADGTFDVVVSSSSFHFWPEPARALQECKRVVKKTGSLVISDWCDDFLLCRVCDRLLRLRYGSSHRVYGAEECERFIREAGFELVRLDRYKISWLWGMMTAVARPAVR